MSGPAPGGALAADRGPRGAPRALYAMALDLAWKAVAALAAGWGGGGAAVAAVWEDLRPVKSDHVGHVFPAWHHATRRSNAASKESSLAYVCSQSSREPNAKDMRLGTGRPDARTATLASALPLCRQGRPQPCPHRRRRSLELGLWKLRPVGPRRPAEPAASEEGRGLR